MHSMTSFASAPLPALVVILVSGIFIAPTILSNRNADSGANEDCKVDEEVLAEQVEAALRCQFYENLGQVDNQDVLFYGNIPGGMIGFEESRILLWMDRTRQCRMSSMWGNHQSDY